MPLEKQISGLASALTLFLIAIILNLLPDYFISPDTTALIAGLVLAAGFIGLGTELSTFRIDKALLNNLFFGMGLFVLWYTIYDYWPHWWWLNVILLIVLFFGINGITAGILKFYFLAVSHPEQLSQDDRLKGLLVFFVAFVGFVASAIQIMQFIQYLRPSD